MEILAKLTTIFMRIISAENFMQNIVCDLIFSSKVRISLENQPRETDFEFTFRLLPRKRAELGGGMDFYQLTWGHAQELLSLKFG